MDEAGEIRERDDALALLASMYESSPVGKAFLDRELRFRRINSALAAMNGLAPAEHLGRTPSELFPGFYAHLEPHLRAVLDRGESRSAIEMRSPSGADVLLTCYPVRRTGGETVGVGLAALDVTERRRVQRERDLALARLDAIFHHAPVGIALFDRDLRYEHVNEALCALGGATAEERLGRTLSEFAPELRPLERHLRRARDEGEATIGVEVTRAVDAGKRDLLATFYPVRDERGDPVGVGLMTVDLTEHRRLERERDAAVEGGRAAAVETQRLLALFDAVIARSPLGIAIFDPELRFRHVNAAFASVTRRPIHEHLGRTADEVLAHDPAQARLVHRHLRQVLATGEPLSDIEREVRCGGETRHLVATLYPVSLGDGEIVAVAELVLDVTERRRIEHERERLEAGLIEAQKMEAIGRLAGGVAHDFNNLLTIILGYVALVSQRLSDDGSVLDPLREIERAARKGSDLVAQMLAFSRRQVLKPTRLDLNEVTRELQPMLQPMLGSRVRVSLDFEQELLPVVADRNQLEQVMINLAANALDAMPDGGQIRLRTRNVELDGESVADRPRPPGPYVLFQVEDTGTGMDAFTLAHAFEPFYTTKEVGKGTGLGLASAYGFVDQSGGLVEIDSEPGGGTTISIYLPVADASADPDAGAGSGGGPTILLVEDDDSLRALSKLLLESSGFRVLAAGSGPEALAIARRAPAVDLLLTDVLMPAMSGPQLAERLRARHPGMPVLLVSGFADDMLAEQLEHGRAGGDPLLAKPFVPAELLRRVSELLERRPVPARHAR